MIGRQVRGALTIIAAVALATVFGGWWALPVVAFASGLGSPKGVRQGLVLGVCAGTAWMLLLALQAGAGVAIGAVAAKVGALFGLPGPLFLLLPPLFALALGWGCATLGEEIGAVVRRERA
ncbi:MAG: hypothetical protein ACK53A_02375 [Gemmatimonadota bacterium]|jgi:hypothetical protein|nr:hypothetical protein [Gemmatimonadota bacterium]